MPSEFSRTFKQPIHVTPATLEELGRIVEDTRKLSFLQGCDKAGIEAREREHFWNNDQSLNDLESSHYKVMKGIASYLKPNFSLSFKDGYTFRSHVLEDLLTEARRTEAKPEALRVFIISSADLRFSLTIRNGVLQSAEFEVQGDRINAEHISMRLWSMLKASRPPQFWLYSPITSSIIYMIVLIVYLICAFLFLNKFFPDKSSLAIFSKTNPVTFQLSIGIMIGAATLGTHALIKSQLPKVDFFIGTPSQGTKSIKTVVIFGMTVIIIPILLHYFGWT